MPPKRSREPISTAAGEFGERLRARRAALGLTQEEMAEQSGMHWSYIGQVERGQRNVTLHALLRLAEVAQVDPADLVRELRAPENEA